jgi:PAS domain S-box-containing protein
LEDKFRATGGEPLKKKLLIVDDDRTIACLIQASLEREPDTEVRIALNGKEAIRILEEFSPDLVISDYAMPEMDGITLLHTIREKDPSLPFIIFTGKGSEGVAMNALNLGATRYLKKSEDYTVLFRLIRDTVISLIEKRKLEQERISRLETCRSVVDHQSELIVRYTPDMRLTFCNPAFCRYLGKDEEKLVGSHFPDHFLKESEPFTRQLSLIGPSSPVVDCDQRIVLPDGRVRWHEACSCAVYGPTPDVLEYQTVARDISRRKMAEESLRRANKRLSLLNCAIRHDVLNQIIVLQGYIELCKSLKPEGELGEYLNRESQSVEKIRESIALTRAYQDLGAREPEWIDLTCCLSEIPLPKACQGKLVIDTGGIEIYADPLVSTAFQNLMENSVFHAGVFSRMHWSFDASGNDLLIVYSDDGKGIPDWKKRDLFKPGMGDHNGYGLYLVKEILSITGIEIAETGREGEGVRFEIRVPPGVFRQA